jgi:hypothetical protein
MEEKSPISGAVRVPSLLVSPGFPKLSSFTEVITIGEPTVPFAIKVQATIILLLDQFCDFITIPG